ncbi:MAG: TonB-dependent receptor, partial [Proteiniphilum sp.]|nr:TonB-dependent receptor [Proteiniphilum sp.]
MKKIKFGFRRKGIQIIVMVCFVQLFSLWESNAQAITIHQTGKSVREILRVIEKTSDMVFFYNNNDVDLNRKVTLQVSDASIEKVLDMLFAGTQNTYKIDGRQVYIMKKPALETVDVRQQKKTVTGIITDVSGESIIGANIVEKGTTNGTVTDIDGKFSLSVENDAVLHISYIGYLSQEIPTAGKTTIDVVLQEDTQALDEVVIVGFGQQKKVSIVGAVQTVRPSELKTSSSSLTSAFAGKIAGVISVQRSGEPGADGANFWIRGISTFAGSTDPLIIVDGVEVSYDILNSLPAESIDQFSLLKDATATALYGTRGANGVMIVTTKTGKESERMNINVRAESGLSMHTQRPEIVDGVTYMNMFNEAYKMRTTAAGYIPKFSQEQIEGTANKLDPYIFPNVDWYGELFKDHTFNQNVNINVTGGGKKINYFLNAGLFNENGLLKNNQANNYNTNIQNLKTILQSNVFANITPTTTMGLKLNTIFRNYNGPYNSTENLYYYTMSIPPTAFPVIFPSTGIEDYTMFGTTDGPYNTGHYPNPYAELVRGYKSTFATTVLGVFNVDQKLDFLLKGLTLKALVSFNNYSETNHNRHFQPYYFKLGNWEQNSEGGYVYDVEAIGAEGQTALSTSSSSYGDRRINLQSSLEYNNSFADIHEVSAMLLYHQKQFNYNSPGNNLLDVLPQREQGLAGRLTYNYDSRYLAEFNFGYNGSENFKKGNRFGFFPSFALGYVISNEPYFQSLKNTISLLKIRSSYGLVGNDKTNSRFPYLTNVELNSLEYTFGYDFDNTRWGTNVLLVGNEDAGWEIGKKYNAGVELGLFGDLTLITDIFKEDRSGIFMQRRVFPASAGLGNTLPYANLGKVRNEGVDISLEYNKALSKDWIVSARANFTYASNKILDKNEPAQQEPYLSEIGLPINTIWGLEALGLFESEDDIANSPVQTFQADYRVG